MQEVAQKTQLHSLLLQVSNNGVVVFLLFHMMDCNTIELATVTVVCILTYNNIAFHRFIYLHMQLLPN